MILTCPQCATRYQADEAKFPPAGRTVRCAKCHCQWHQPGFAVEPETVPGAAFQENIAGASPTTAAWTRLPDDTQPQPQLRARDEGQSKPARPAQIMLAAGLVALITTLLVIALLAHYYREDIAVIWSRALNLEPSATRQIETQGIELRNVGYQRENDDGQTMLVITGTIANSADYALAVPKTIRVTLSDEYANDLFYATIPAHVARLGPGESVTFRTRIHDLPATNLHLQMRLEE